MSHRYLCNNKFLLHSLILRIINLRSPLTCILSEAHNCVKWNVTYFFKSAGRLQCLIYRYQAMRFRKDQLNISRKTVPAKKGLPTVCQENNLPRILNFQWDVNSLILIPFMTLLHSYSSFNSLSHFRSLDQGKSILAQSYFDKRFDAEKKNKNQTQHNYTILLYLIK